jgi:hypothetical protein
MNDRKLPAAVFIVGCQRIINDLTGQLVGHDLSLPAHFLAHYLAPAFPDYADKLSESGKQIQL